MILGDFSKQILGLKAELDAGAALSYQGITTAKGQRGTQVFLVKPDLSIRNISYIVSICHTETCHDDDTLSVIVKDMSSPLRPDHAEFIISEAFKRAEAKAA
jgi:hypothetical protein